MPLATLLGQLAADRASGAVLCTAGTLYLAHGNVVHADSPAAPGVELLLTRAGRLDERSWQQALHAGGAGGRPGATGGGTVAGALVEGGHLTRGELEICHLSALFDAAWFVLADSGAPARFRAGARHWLGPVRPVAVPALRRELHRRAGVLDRLWPYPQVDITPLRPAPARTAPAAGPPLPPPAPLTPRQRDVLRLADGSRTPADVAAALGRPVFRVLLDVRRLAAAGVVETPRTPPGPAPPRRTPTPPPGPAPPGHIPEAPDIATLRRIRDALEAHL
ncbi:transcriptional regulator [Streptomyces sp. TRM 70351]|uniref:transcriptional regulator n=1 Tax=Streptomyces sp. TRM 70351 TaxID=3116552 RepID=UPI002E7AE4DE|nr:transcriptional regulator [Streptomyces sp. TRM 70351]MEE1929806.1 transcriptional regulator [Streptomyces sp. TRM 70351]